MKSGPSRPLRPTLWRTCRTLANRTRLKLFYTVLLAPGMSVAEIAATIRLDAALASRHLRFLNARGLLSVTRRGPSVHYRVEADPVVPQASSLVAVLAKTFRTERTASDLIFRKVTAFTHPRRVAIACELLRKPLQFAELRRHLGISTAALKRHLRKLDSRGFLRRNTGRGIYAVITSGSPLEMALLKLTTTNKGQI